MNLLNFFGENVTYIKENKPDLVLNNLGNPVIFQKTTVEDRIDLKDKSIDVIEVSYQTVDNIPDEKKNTYIIVTEEVKKVLWWREDLVTLWGYNKDNNTFTGILR